MGHSHPRISPKRLTSAQSANLGLINVCSGFLIPLD